MYGKFRLGKAAALSHQAAIVSVNYRVCPRPDHRFRDIRPPRAT